MSTRVDIRKLKTLLSAKVVKGKVVLCPHYSGHVADFHLKWSMLMEKPQNNITGVYVLKKSCPIRNSP